VEVAKIGIFTRFIMVWVFLKESLKCAKIYIVGSGERFFINKKEILCRKLV